MTTNDKNGEKQYHIRADSGETVKRLDRFLADALPDFSRSRLKGLIETGRVVREKTAAKSAETIADPSYRVKPGESFTLNVPPAEPATPTPQVIALDIVYEDDQVIVLNKQAGLVVHPAPGNPDKTLVNALLAHCGDTLSGIGGVKRPGIVHRIDKDTSGLMIVAKTDKAHASLAAQFAEHSLERAYLAVVWGVPRPLKGEITGNIGRNPRNRKKMAVVNRGGKEALTRYKVLKTLGKQTPPLASLVECRLATGRTHQIRVHFAHRHHPLIGDPLYGRRDLRRADLSGPLKEAAASLENFNRQALHAYIIGFKHPESGEFLQFQSNIPKEIEGLLTLLDKI